MLGRGRTCLDNVDISGQDAFLCSLRSANRMRQVSTRTIQLPQRIQITKRGNMFQLACVLGVIRVIGRV